MTILNRTKLGIFSTPVLQVGHSPLIARTNRFSALVGPTGSAGRMHLRPGFRPLVPRWLAFGDSGRTGGYAPMSLELRRRIRAEQQRRIRTMHISWPRSPIEPSLPRAHFVGDAGGDHAGMHGDPLDTDFDVESIAGFDLEAMGGFAVEPDASPEVHGDGAATVAGSETDGGRFAPLPRSTILPGPAAAMRTVARSAGGWMSFVNDAANPPLAIGFVAPSMPLTLGDLAVWEQREDLPRESERQPLRARRGAESGVTGSSEVEWTRAEHVLRSAGGFPRRESGQRTTVIQAQWQGTWGATAGPRRFGQTRPGSAALSSWGSDATAVAPTRPSGDLSVDAIRAPWSGRSRSPDALATRDHARSTERVLVHSVRDVFPLSPLVSPWVRAVGRGSTAVRSAAAAAIGDLGGVPPFAARPPELPALPPSPRGRVWRTMASAEETGDAAVADIAGFPWAGPTSRPPTMSLTLGVPATVGHALIGRLSTAFPLTSLPYQQARERISHDEQRRMERSPAILLERIGPSGQARTDGSRRADVVSGPGAATWAVPAPGARGLPLVTQAPTAEIFRDVRVQNRVTPDARQMPPWAAAWRSADALQATAGLTGLTSRDLAARSPRPRSDTTDPFVTPGPTTAPPFEIRSWVPHWTDMDPSLTTRHARSISRHEVFPAPLASPFGLLPRGERPSPTRPSGILPGIGSGERSVVRQASYRVDERFPVAPSAYPTAGPQLAESPAAPVAWALSPAQANPVAVDATPHAATPIADAWLAVLPRLVPRATRPLRMAPQATSPFLGQLARFLHDGSPGTGAMGGIVAAPIPRLPAGSVMGTFPFGEIARLAVGAPHPPSMPAPRAEAAAAAHLPVFRSARWDRPEPTQVERSTAATLMAGSTGAPLPPLMRRSMEHLVGADLAAVRIHSGPSIARAADLLAARAMTRGTDVFMPSGVQDSAAMGGTAPLLAHELTHVAQHLGGGPRRMGQPLVLAQRHATEEHAADQIERAVRDGLSANGATAGYEPTTMTLARTAATADVVQRAEVPQPPAVVPAAETPHPAGGQVDTAKLAEQVFSLLERQLVIERERGGFRR